MRKDFFKRFPFFQLEIFRKSFEWLAEEKIFDNANIFLITFNLSSADFLLSVPGIAAKPETIADLGIKAKAEMRFWTGAIRKIPPEHAENQF